MEPDGLTSRAAQPNLTRQIVARLNLHPPVLPRPSKSRCQTRIVSWRSEKMNSFLADSSMLRVPFTSFSGAPKCLTEEAHFVNFKHPTAGRPAHHQ